MSESHLLLERASGLTGRETERDVLGRLANAVRAGQSRVLLMRGEPGVGKTALLDHLAEQASDCLVARVAGVQSEMEIAFAGLHHLLAPMLSRVDRLPVPQREALEIAFGLRPGLAPERFLIGLAVLSLLSDTAEDRPMLCLIDDEQWLDSATTQVLAFVARRLEAESVGLVFAARVPSDALLDLPSVVVEGLRDADARTLLDSVLTAPLDVRVREQLVAETRGNPLALLELPRGLSPEELAGGFGLPSAGRLTNAIEESFRRRLDALPAESRRLLLLAAADPVGDPSLVVRAAGLVGIPAESVTPAAEADLLDIGVRVRFRHPLVRSAAYRSASLRERQDVHRALAEATDPEVDPDRRAWHRAHATAGHDDDVASELEQSADRAQARGGLAAAAAFLERAALLTSGPARRADRLLAAATAKRDAGALEAALGLLVAVEAGPPDALRTAETEHLRGRIALMQRRNREAGPLLLGAARLLAPLDAAAAREAHLEALVAAMWAGGVTGGLSEAAEAARAAPPISGVPRAADLLLDGLAIRHTEGHGAAAPTLRRALELILALDVGTDRASRWRWLSSGRTGAVVALELWDADSSFVLATEQVRFSREVGALVDLQLALTILANSYLLAGELARAAEMIDEDRLIAEATGNPRVASAEMTLAAWRGDEERASALSGAAVREATARGGTVNLATYASLILYNGVGRHDAACDAARAALDCDQFGYGHLYMSELAEAASRTGDRELLEAALDWLAERTRVTDSAWALGIEARVRAFITEGDAAERLHCKSIERLERTRVRAELARAHLLYGEWLRRERRRVDARTQLRTAHEMLASMGMDAFADRARRELQATGEQVRKRTVDTRLDLTAQEAQIARLAREGLTNPEIGTRLFISPRTVQYHLSKVFMKLDISKRNQLGRVLPSDSPASTNH